MLVSESALVLRGWNDGAYSALAVTAEAREAGSEVNLQRTCRLLCLQLLVLQLLMTVYVGVRAGEARESYLPAIVEALLHETIENVFQEVLCHSVFVLVSTYIVADTLTRRSSGTVAISAFAGRDL